MQKGPPKNYYPVITANSPVKWQTHSFVLLKNNDQILPLKKSGTIALIGPLADNQRNMLGTWSVSGDPSKSVTVMEGIKNVAGWTEYYLCQGSQYLR